MDANAPKISLTSSRAVATELEHQLLLDLRSTSEQGENAGVMLELRDPTGALMGGLVGSTSYGWLLIKVLWVAETLRGHGYGHELIERAIAQAKTAGCHSAWLETSSPSSLTFYEHLGFVRFGVLSNGDLKPGGHSRFFLKRRI